MALEKNAPEGTDSCDGSNREIAFADAVSFLTDKFASTKVRGNLPLSHNLDNLERYAETKGLEAGDIQQILDVVLTSKFPATVNRRLVRLLLPRESVSIGTVTKALSWMCHGSENFPLMVLLMRWLVLIHSYVDDKERLHSLYDVIFYFLHSDLICPHACELLYHLTRKEDVRLYRVQALLQLQRKKGAEPYLLGVLMVYKLYCPHLVSVSIPASRKTFFRATDRSWAERIRAVQRGRLHGESGNDVLGKPPPSKRAKKTIPAVVPAVLSANSCESTNQLYRNGITSQLRPLVPFAQIKSFKQLLRNLDSLELPGQLAAALRDRNLQHVLVCYPDPAIPLRITYWLDHSLNQEFFVNGAADKAYCTELLDTLLTFTQFLQEAVPVCEQFLSIYLQTWSGVDFRSQLLNLVTFSRLHSFSDMCDLFLEPLRKLFFCSDVYLKCEILGAFTALLRNLVQVELPRYRHARQSADVTTLSHHEHNRYSVFKDIWEEDFSALDTIQELVRLTDSMCSVGLQVEANHPLLCHAVLNFFELVSGLYAFEGLPVVDACSQGIVYKQLFTDDPVSLARVFGLINRYRASYVALQACRSDDLSDEERLYRSASLTDVTAINSYIVNICDTLTRDKAYVSTNNRSVYSVLGDDLSRADKVKWAKSLSLYRHPALLSYSSKFLKQTQKEGNLLHPDQIKPHRQVYLKFLAQHGLGEIAAFISTFIAKRKSSSSGSHMKGSNPSDAESYSQKLASD